MYGHPNQKHSSEGILVTKIDIALIKIDIHDGTKRSIYCPP